MTSSPNYCSLFRKEAAKVWTDMSDTARLSIPRTETTTTEELLLRFARGQHRTGLYVAADTNERNTGGDWLFWFASKGRGGLPVRVQAKRIYASGRYEQLYHPYIGPSKQGYNWTNQCEALLGFCKIDGAIPLYVFYNSDTLVAASAHQRARLFVRLRTGLPEHQRRASGKIISLPPQFWGITIASPLAVKNANWGKYGRPGDFPMVPWHCLVCSSCWNDRPNDFSLPSRIGHYLHQLYRCNGSTEGIQADLSELEISFEPTNATPKWVGLLREGNDARSLLLAEMEALSLKGVAIIEENEARHE